MDKANRECLSFEEKLEAFPYTIGNDYEAGTVKKHEAEYMMNNMRLPAND